MRLQIKEFSKTNVQDFGFAEEMIATALNPCRLKRELYLYNYNISDDEYMDWDVYKY
jgi:hypothetical protein